LQTPTGRRRAGQYRTYRVPRRPDQHLRREQGHGCRAFLPIFIERGGGHIVNTASIAGLLPGPGPAYDASKHAVVAITEDLHHMVKMTELPIGVSVVCPGWVHTSILDADRNWPTELGERPQPNAGAATIASHYRKAIDNGLAPAAVADTVIDAVEHGHFWVFPSRSSSTSPYDAST
jgi:NAD(P)-dependent dehydrogenase (short-subunit alcohol dehydrogenase family)